jgi:hypothetical protein
MITTVLLLSLSASAQEGPVGWRAHDALGAPAWLSFGLEHRSRVEYLQGDFRATATGDSAGLLMRTLLSAGLKLDPFVANVELIDARAYTLEGTPLNTTLIDPIDLLQANVGLRFSSLLLPGDAFAVTAGRMTVDVGSRRLVARNDFRNTINNFTGIDVQWTSPQKLVLRAFALLPVVRLPSTPDALGDNAIELDHENLDALLWGTYLATGELAGRVQIESYLLGLDERDGVDTPSANRQLLTPGVRLLRAPKKGDFDFQVEAILQLGSSRLSTADTDENDLVHHAASTHVSAGYRFDVPWTPRIALLHDYASGDADPNDGENGRFDTLFGARRFDFGPTGLYGPVARSNINSPGARVDVNPLDNVDAFIGYRLFWLASARDAWGPAGVRDPLGKSGDFIGQQAELRVRWHVLPKNLSAEFGAAELLPGDFVLKAPNAHPVPSTFLYTQVTAQL